jgi:hypothetical protein
MNNFVMKLKQIDKGRFSKLIDACDMTGDHCIECYHFNPDVTDPSMSYRCKCAPGCPAATLHPDLVKYIWSKLK